ncbi:uncharacterized protein DUF664 [Stackebrandtia endophytica]|uniref:Uncharacterized protein DUF664 n=1 Tax=Stackebrandtia endophytica TaxID=1496996 RepID=A0A543B1P8_9ACTN|nr:DinB family protein [Stackebrandtia endophytica]TQL78754.1 uncharacterized protein DUF664 [Stackebrandtia endophytica]
MNQPRIRPDLTGDERTQLTGWLDLQRSILLWKCEGLSDADAHRALIPTSPLMTMAGLIAHMRWVENTWFEVMFLGRPADGPQFDADDDDADMRVDGIPMAQLVEEYRAQCEISNEIIAAHPLEHVGAQLPRYRASHASLRWMLVHMVEETARHVGHADLLRELLDGQRGYY